MLYKLSNKRLLLRIANGLTSDNYHRLARIFYEYSERPDVEDIKFNEFLVWFNKNWRDVIT
jgi:hypothetical protein